MVNSGDESLQRREQNQLPSTFDLHLLESESAPKTTLSGARVSLKKFLVSLDFTPDVRCGFCPFSLPANTGPAPSLASDCAATAAAAVATAPAVAPQQPRKLGLPPELPPPPPRTPRQTPQRRGRLQCWGNCTSIAPHGISCLHKQTSRRLGTVF